MSASQLDRLLADAEDDLLAAKSPAYREARFDDPGERATAVGWTTANPRANALLLLLALRREAPEAYAEIPAAARAEVLAAALRERAVLNDFGYLDESGGYDREAGQALLELGDAAIGPLRPVLDDMNDGNLSGSEEATLADEYGLRRADFAYRYITRILGRDEPFDPDPAARDRRIAALREELDAASAGRGG
jgi:hypothetical protein